MQLDRLYLISKIETGDVDFGQFFFKFSIYNILRIHPN